MHVFMNYYFYLKSKRKKKKCLKCSQTLSPINTLRSQYNINTISIYDSPTNQ